MVAKVSEMHNGSKAEHLKKCVMAVSADVRKPTRKVAGVRVKE